VIIISRTDAPPWLARHFASGDVGLVGWADLRLTTPEITGLIRIYRPDLRGQRLKAVLPQIVELANGWAAVLTLLLQTRRLAPIDDHGMEEFSGKLFDYFATEILDKSAVAERDFLLKTSVVRQFTAALAARLAGRTDIGELLSDLERQSFLTQRLGTSGAYRYHPLLRDFLLRRAATVLGPQAVRQLHRSAAEALMESDNFDEAMEQFEVSRDVEAVVGLLLRVAGSYIANGRGRTIESWLHRLPSQRIEQNGWLLHWAAASCLAYSPSRSRELFERAFAHFVREGDAAGRYGCCAGALQAVSYEGMENSRCDVWLERFAALEQEGVPCPDPVKPMMATAMLMACVFRKPEDGRHWAERARMLAATCEDGGHRIMTAGFLAIHAVFHENVDRAAIFVGSLRESAQASESSALAVLTLLQATLVHAWASGDNATCIDLVREALALAARTGVFVWNDQICGTGLAAALASEDFEAARELLALSRSSAEIGRNFSVGVYHFYSSWDAFLRGDRARALRLIELATECAKTLGFPLAEVAVQFARSQILWTEGRKEEARVILERSRQDAEREHYPFLRYGCDLVESDHEWDEDRQRALARLQSGFAIAREGGYHNAFWLGKSTLTRAAVRALEHGIEPEHVRATIVKCRLVPPVMPACPEGWPFRYRLRALGSFEFLRKGSDTQARSTNGIESRARTANANAAPRGMPLRLLQAILAFGARAVRDTQLIDALWPDAEGDAGRRVFDTTLHRLRSQMGADDIVRLRDGRVSLDERLCWVDVLALEHALSEAERYVERRAPGPALAPIAHQVLALYRGPLLADEPSDWARGPRNQLAGRFRRTVERLAGVLETAGQHSEAKALYERAFQANQREPA